MTETCSSCKHWNPQPEGYTGQEEGFGVCKSAPHFTHEAAEKGLKTVTEANMVVIDGEDYYAALLTKPGHSCSEWEPGQNN